MICINIEFLTLGPRFKDPKLVLKAWGFLMDVLFVNVDALTQISADLRSIHS